MFGKLFKDAWRDSFRILGILTGAVAAAILMALAYLFLDSYTDHLVIRIVASLLLVVVTVAALGLVVYPIAVWGILLARFYKNIRIAEESSGIAPPAKAWQVFPASLLNMLIWLSISLLLWMPAKELLIHVLSLERVLDPWYWDITGYGAQWPLNLIQLIVAGVCYATLSLTCLTLGSVMPRKLSLPVALLCFLSVMILADTLCEAVLPRISVWYYAEIVKAQIYSPQEYPLIAQLFPIGLHIVVTAACCFLSVGLLKKKRNLR